MKNPPLDLLKYCAFPELAVALRKCEEQVLARWEQMVRQVLPAAEELTLAQLRDHVPAVLAQMAEALESDQAAATHDLIDISKPHGEARFHQHYNINELLIEYHCLRRILTEEISEELGRDLTTTEKVALDLGVDTALRRGVVTFAEHQTQQLQSANELQSRYLSFLSHDLRGGLNGALLMVEVLKRELQKEARFAETIEDLDIMRRSILDTVGTMDRFLHAERLRKGKVQPQIAPFDLKHAINDLVSQASYLAKNKGLDIKAETPDAAELTSDRELVTLILQNLVSNAVKYTKAGIVTVSTRARGTTGGYVISVADQGPGIAPDQQEQIFTPFTRGETHGQGGVGLGLSIARHAADLLGARISVDSEVGAGATFHVDVPAGKVTPEEHTKV